MEKKFLAILYKDAGNSLVKISTFLRESVANSRYPVYDRVELDNLVIK